MMLSTTCAKVGRIQHVSKICRQLQTSAIVRAEKTPIQKFGWEYLVRMEGSPRPLSPHINIYKPMLTWMLSGLHRISGCVMAGTLLVGGTGFALLPIDFTTLIEFIRALNLPCAVTTVFKFVIAFPIVYHTLNGVRFLAFDMAIGTPIKTVYKTGKGVVAVSALIAAAIALYATINKPKSIQK